ncbi:MAG: hypothetical protein HOV81_29895 [Kofleriaceae bacterium]|nr:hypothetical protein [Kofleriaceae bacterium]
MSKRRKKQQVSTKEIKSQVLAKVAKAKALPQAAETIGFTDVEEEFFRAGADLEQGTPSESFDDLETPRQGFWRRLFPRAQTA